VYGDQGRRALLILSFWSVLPLAGPGCGGCMTLRIRTRECSLAAFSITATAPPQGILSAWKRPSVQAAASTIYVLAARCEGSRASSGARRGCVASLRVLWTRRAPSRYIWLMYVLRSGTVRLPRTLLLAGCENRSWLARCLHTLALRTNQLEISLLMHIARPGVSAVKS
jgi:hypothetical protein